MCPQARRSSTAAILGATVVMLMAGACSVDTSMTGIAQRVAVTPEEVELKWEQPWWGPDEVPIIRVRLSRCPQSAATGELETTFPGTMIKELSPQGGYVTMLTDEPSECRSWFDGGVVEDTQRALINFIFVYDSPSRADLAWSKVAPDVQDAPGLLQGTKTGLGPHSSVLLPINGTGTREEAKWQCNRAHNGTSYSFIILLLGVNIPPTTFVGLMMGRQGECKWGR